MLTMSHPSYGIKGTEPIDCDISGVTSQHSYLLHTAKSAKTIHEKRTYSPYTVSILLMERQLGQSELAEAAGSGSSEALSELIERIRPGLFRKAYYALGNYADAQDAVAITVLQICRHIADLRDPESVCAWIYGILKNEIYKSSKAVRFEPRYDDSPDGCIIDVSLMEIDIRRALRCIPYNQAQAIALYYLGGLSIENISHRLQRPTGTIKRWLHMGRKGLAVELGEYAMSQHHVSAVLFNTQMDANMSGNVVQALKNAGFSSVRSFASMPPLVKIGDGDTLEFHLPEELVDADFVLFDEMVGGRSVFELHTIFKAAIESQNMAFGVLLDSPPSDNTIFAAWAAGFDLCLTKSQLNMDELTRFAARIRETLS